MLHDASEHRELEMKRRAGMEPEGGSRKRKEVGNDNSLASMFAKQHVVSVRI